MEALIKPNKIYFRNLDSIRFFAALMVFFRHGIEDGYKYLNIRGTILGRFLYAISDGGVGVSIFFVLSGFLITYLILSEIDLTQRFSLKNFYIRRVLRIWPLYFAVVAIGFLVFPLLRSLLKIDTISDGASPWYQCAFISNFDVIHINKLNPNALETMHSITWSVSIEEQFYAVWPLIFAFLPRKSFLPTIISVLLGSLIFRLYNLGDFYTLYFHTFSAMLYLGTGALFAYLIISNSKVKDFFKQTSSFTILSSFILFFFSMMYRDILFGSSIGTLFEPIYFALLFAYIIASQSMITPSAKFGLGKIEIANKLGKYTYGMYLLHPVAIMIIQAVSIKLLHVQMNTFLNIFISGIFGLLLTVIIAWFSYEFYESKFLALKKSFSVITKESI